MTPHARPLAAAIAAHLALVIGVALVPERASGHEYWFAPSAFRACPGDTIRVGPLAGEGFVGERKVFAPGRAVRWVVRAGRELNLIPAASTGDTTWARFAPEDRERLAVHGGRTYDGEDQAALKLLKDHRVEIYSVPPKEMERWRAAAKTVTEQWMADLDRRGLDARGLYKLMVELAGKR